MSELRTNTPEVFGLSKARAYQLPIIFDDSRFVSWVKSRQIGGSWAVAARIARRAYEHRIDQVVMSRGERQAIRLLEKIAMHVKAIDTVRVHQFGAKSMIESITKKGRIDLAGNVVIQAMPCDDETTVGDAADVTLDEYGLFPKSEDIYSALTPVIMNGFSITVVSSPRGRKNMFAKICLSEGDTWSKHKTTLYDAERGGLQLVDQKGRHIKAEEFLNDLRKSGMSETAIRQEFLCEFIDSATAYIPLDLIRKLQDKSLSMHVDWKRLSDPKAEIYAGLDIGRFHDLTALWLWEVVDKKKICRGVMIMRDTPFGTQEAEIEKILAHPSVRRMCIDRTGIGAHMAERFESKYGKHRIEGIAFTSATKERMAGAVKADAEKENLAIPHDDLIENDWHAIEQSVTAAGNIRFDADRSAGGHADRFWAAALGLIAIDDKPFELAMSFAGAK